jgi:two-component system, response regulator, stage 0 sporulation protein F
MSWKPNQREGQEEKGLVMEQKTVLVVEDDPNQRELYIEELKTEGYNVLSAGNGREALNLAKEQSPDIIVLDINMPGMDGLDTLSHLLEVNRRTPVIINTAYASYQDSFTSWSADAYVVKSSNLDELLGKIKELLNK